MRAIRERVYLIRCPKCSHLQQTISRMGRIPIGSRRCMRCDRMIKMKKENIVRKIK